MKRSSLFRKIVSLLIVMAMMFSMLLLAGCKKKEENENNELPPSDNLPEDNGGYVNEKAEEGRTDFIDELGGVSETYKGSVSLESYESAEAAAIAFVNEEVVGEKEATVESVNAKGTLSASEVNALNLPADLREGITSVEKLEVTYSVDSLETVQGEAVVAPCSATESSNVVVIVYVIKYENEWKYYSPAPINGNTITKSYYDSVFNSEKYKNCTLETEMAFSLNVSGTDGVETHTISMEISAKQLIKHADGKVYAEVTTKTVTAQDGQTQTVEQTMYLYLEDTGDEVLCYVKTSKDGTWIKGNLNMSGFTSIDELTPFHDQYLDYTYFTKTNFGFAIEKENAKLYLAETLEAMADVFPASFDQEDMIIDMYAEYYVSDGVLSGMRTDASIEFSMVEDGVTANAEETVYGYTTVTDYGTTVVESPVE